MKPSIRISHEHIILILLNESNASVEHEKKVRSKC